MFSKGRKRLKERTLNKSLTLGEKQMAQVTYRGVQYTTGTQKSEKQQSELTYRGQKYVAGAKK